MIAYPWNERPRDGRNLGFPEMQIANERRGQPRATLETTVIAFIGDERIECRAVDISANGIALLSPVVRSNGQFLRVNFALPQPGGLRWLDADGVVARVARAEQGILLGVQFIVIEDRAAREVHAYVEHTRLAAAHARQQETYVRRVSGSGSTPTGTMTMPRVGGSVDEGHMPDANHPPRVTGEFIPAGQQPQRRTQEYASPEASAPIGTARTMEAPRVGERTPTGEQQRSAGESGRWPTESSDRSPSESSAAGRWPGEPAGAAASSSHSSGTGRYPGESPAGARSATGTPGRADSTGGGARREDATGSGQRRTTRPPEASAQRRPTSPPAAEAPRMSKTDLAALYRDALDEVEGKKPAKKKK
jgi:PilZ domain-containing protein